MGEQVMSKAMDDFRRLATSRNDGGPACTIGSGDVRLRDYFAVNALQGLLSNPNITYVGVQPGWIENYAYAWADAMLKARAK